MKLNKLKKKLDPFRRRRAIRRLESDFGYYYWCDEPFYYEKLLATTKAISKIKQL